jgi:hypothetical protein
MGMLIWLLATRRTHKSVQQHNSLPPSLSFSITLLFLIDPIAKYLSQESGRNPPTLLSIQTLQQFP